ncbi:ABC transporter permease [Acuticoccus mangrovi]|uniref:ABC transporter permease n=1 Tax=Acuticoccus mangrovi TaxID=2796142 RepID=A0A934IRN5_9HYPH|nr:ABC transporter permease [Acuticoccus mangrovi]MBJ3776805.1 ABC transporter permease [Acuticoccus mangrovi]
MALTDAESAPRFARLRWIWAPGNRKLVFLLILFALFILAAVFAPLIAPEDPFRQNLLGRLKPPGTTARGTFFLLGSDELGRDVLSRVLYGARISLAVAFSSVIASALIGVSVGMFAAYRGGIAEAVLMRLTDIILSVPGILIALIVVAALGPGMINVILVLTITRWPRYARVAYAQTLQLSSQPFVRLSKHMGSSTVYILTRHVLPNIIGPLAVVATLEFGLMILWEASLSFLGLGVQPPTPSLGNMLSGGRVYAASAWWIATIPGLVLFALIAVVNVMGDELRDRLDPKGR